MRRPVPVLGLLAMSGCYTGYTRDAVLDVLGLQSDGEGFAIALINERYDRVDGSLPWTTGGSDDAGDRPPVVFRIEVARLENDEVLQGCEALDATPDSTPGDRRGTTSWHPTHDVWRYEGVTPGRDVFPDLDETRLVEVFGDIDPSLSLKRCVDGDCRTGQVLIVHPRWPELLPDELIHTHGRADDRGCAVRSGTDGTVRVRTVKGQASTYEEVLAACALLERPSTGLDLAGEGTMRTFMRGAATSLDLTLPPLEPGERYGVAVRAEPTVESSGPGDVTSRRPCGYGTFTLP